MKKYAFAALLAALTLAIVGCTEKQPDITDTFVSTPADGTGAGEASEGASTASEVDGVPEDIADAEGFRPMPVFEIYGDSVEKAGDETHPHVYAEFPSLMLAADTAKAYPAFADSAAILNDEMKTAAEDFVAEYGSFEVEEATGMNAEWESTETLSPSRVDTIVASFERYLYTYTGGVHGNGGHRGATYDMMSGRELKLSDVLTDVRAVIVQLDDKLLAENDPVSFFDPETLEETFLDYLEKDEFDFFWNLTEEGIRFYFNQYEIGPYASGVFEVNFTYEELGDLFVDAYRPAVG